ncbi:spore germination protein GerPC [Virgibacillus oceani]|uniref:Spore germination protein GerPC n=1 Tax=Virgibacillus oceani TaxID=1479511 RepID=A0A917M3U6_9BACI|nr:spore germination protein GerPC [Virgibacillus oceani]GGG75262.1 putative spore germination protein GerPC [Virgibacillus oceani]
MNGNEWTNYVYDLHQYIQKQDDEINKLKTRVTQLEQDVREKNSNTIEKIEYHFDQLKIENLDGTLHIGLSPSDLANIGDIGIPKGTQPNYQPPMKQQLVSNLSQHLQQNGPPMIRDLAIQYNKPIDNGFQSMLLNDIEKQLPHRIAFYEQEAKNKRGINSDESLQAYITDQVKNEIYQSLLKYMQKNDHKGEEQ